MAVPARLYLPEESSTVSRFIIHISWVRREPGSASLLAQSVSWAEPLAVTKANSPGRYYLDANFILDRA